MMNEEEFGEDEDEEEEEEEGTEEGTPKGSRVVKKRKKKKRGCCYYKPPAWFVKFSNKTEETCETKQFERIIVVLILFNTFFMSIEHYQQPDWVT
jgi:hypothetical protein